MSSPPSRSQRNRMFLVAVVGVVVAAVFALVRHQTGDQPSDPEGSGDTAGLPTGPIVEDNETALAGYAGSESCRACHEAEFGKWQGSHHGLAEREFRPDMDLAGFEPPKVIEHGTQKSEARMVEDLAEFIMKGYPDRDDHYEVVRVIGHDPLRQFLIAGPNDHLQTAELCWDPHKNEWFNVYGDEDRQPGEWGHWTGRGMNWNSMCANCHNTRLRKNYDIETDRYHPTMAEMSVGCEACHGPMKSHVDWQQQHAGKPNDPTLKPFTREQHTQTCAPCHARRAELTGDLVPGSNFYDHFNLTVPDETDLYYPDGQVLEENYVYSSFIGSKMHAAGVRCMDCHDPHSADRLLPGNAVCMKCHAVGGDTPIAPLTKPAPLINPTAHSRHKEGSPGNDCTGCHMPTTTYMQRDPRHDHGFSSPDPLLTKELGIPNACNRCHDDKDADWALEYANEWYGDKLDRPERHRTITFAKARRGEFSARDELIKILRGDEETAPWKASAALLVGRWVADRPVMTILRRQLEHEHPLVRAAAVRSLGPAAQADSPEARSALAKMLEDPVRNVRVAAAWALRDTVDLESVAGRELVHSLEHTADQPSGQMRLGQFKFARGERTEAVAHLRKAIEWDPNSPPFHHDLAVMLNMTGDNEGSIASLEEACRLAPEEAEYHYKLALALNEQGFLPRAAKVLQRTVEIDPGHGRAWYNLGLAYNSLQDPAKAIDALLQGERVAAGDPAIPYARATIHARLGQRGEAIAAARRALEIDPQFVQAQQMLISLGAR